MSQSPDNQDKSSNFANYVEYEETQGRSSSSSSAGRSAAVAGFGEDGPASGASESEADAYASRTKQPLWGNPFAKVGIVGAGTLAAVLSVNALLGDVAKETSRPEPIKPELVKPEATVAPPKTDDNGKILAEVALGNQARDLAALGKNIVSPPPAKPVPPPPVAALPPRPRPAPVERAEPQPAPKVASIQQDQDPQKQWETLSRVGSFGQSGASQSGTGKSGPENSSAQGENRDIKGADIKGSVAQNQNPGKADNADTRDTKPDVKPVNNNEEEPPLLTGQVRRSLLTGTTAQGLLSTPIVWEGAREGATVGADREKDAAGIDADERYIIQLTSSLKSADGSDVFPVGTPVVVKVRAVSASGNLRLSATSAIVKGEETPLPEGALSIRASAGGPLIAKNTLDRGPEIGSSDAGVFALAGIGKAASLFTRQQSTVVTSGFNATIANQNPPPDILAGVLEGGTNAIVDQIKSRNEKAIQESLARPNTWLLSAGTNVQVFVNKSVPSL
jgi:Bacterial conjugation TrbI-like protein